MDRNAPVIHRCQCSCGERVASFVAFRGYYTRLNAYCLIEAAARTCSAPCVNISLTYSPTYYVIREDYKNDNDVMFCMFLQTYN